MDGQAHRAWRSWPLGEAALLFEASPDTSDANRLVLALAAHLETLPPPGLRSALPASHSLLVQFDPRITSHAVLAELLAELLPTLDASAEQAGREIVVPVRYGGEHGPDLAEAAAALGRSPAELVALHTGAAFRVMMVGFAPGFPYIGPLPFAAGLGRRATPRAAVPAGSVAIAAGMTGIYPARLPGGWHIIGHTDLRLFDPHAEPPSRFLPGDWVRFAARTNSLPLV